ncbi:MAG TPA: hypothetical protein VGN07_12975 [Steroidobacteraceae bacterium]|jgi:hypothetical protein
MNKVRVTVLLAMAVVLAACVSTPPAPVRPKAPDLTGDWIVTTTSQVGEQDSSMSVRQTGDAIAGTLSGQMGNVDYTGSVTADAVAFSFVIDAQGSDLRIEYSGTVAGDTMKGKAVFGSFGEGTFTARRR